MIDSFGDSYRIYQACLVSIPINAQSAVKLVFFSILYSAERVFLGKFLCSATQMYQMDRSDLPQTSFLQGEKSEGSAVSTSPPPVKGQCVKHEYLNIFKKIF